jgi:light-harvesting complex I chlorophyll a/b binding protein 1
MFKLFTMLSLFTSIVSLNTNIKPVFRGITKPLDKSPLFKFGSLPLIKNIQPSFLREAELKHCRIAMLASLVIPTIEIFTNEPGIFQFSNLPNDMQVSLVCLMFTGEFYSMLKGWKNPKDKLFELNDDYQPGDLGLSNKDININELNILMDKELNNGRLAMIGVLGYIVQELITNESIFKII